MAKSQKLRPTEADVDALVGKPNEFDQYTDVEGKKGGRLNSEALVILGKDDIEPLSKELTSKQVSVVTSTWTTMYQKYGPSKIGSIFLKQLLNINKEVFSRF